MTGHGGHGQDTFDIGGVLLVLVGIAAAVYLAAAWAENRRGKRVWPAYRSGLWLLGLGLVSATLVGPLAQQSHTSFSAHMAAHLLVGMLAPLLLVLSAPVTLALRTLPVTTARRVSQLLNSGVMRFFTHPITAAVINVGSLWVVYTTPLSEAMLNSLLLHYLLLVHFLIAGYLFTASMVSVDPAPHQPGFRLRLAVLLLAVAAHSILAKHIYIHPPAGTTAPAAELGGVLMFYGGDLTELALIVVFFAQWYTHARPKTGLAHNNKKIA